MTGQITSPHEGDYIQVLCASEKSYRIATELWTEIRDACQSNACFKVPGIARTTAPVETRDALEKAELFEKPGIDNSFRIAWVEMNPEAYRTACFIESVLSNRGFPGRVSLEVAAAKDWLR